MSVFVNSKYVSIFCHTDTTAWAWSQEGTHLFIFKKMLPVIKKGFHLDRWTTQKLYEDFKNAKMKKEKTLSWNKHKKLETAWKAVLNLIQTIRTKWCSWSSMRIDLVYKQWSNGSGDFFSEKKTYLWELTVQFIFS